MTTAQVYQDRLYVHWSLHLTTSFPLRLGVDGRYVVCADPEEAEYLRDRLAPGADLHPFGETWDRRALALADLWPTYGANPDRGSRTAPG